MALSCCIVVIIDMRVKNWVEEFSPIPPPQTQATRPGKNNINNTVSAFKKKNLNYFLSLSLSLSVRFL